MENKLENLVNHRVALLAALLKRQVFRIIAKNKLEITPEQWVVIYYLWLENGLTVGEIANRSKKDFANVTRIIDKLEKMGYISKRKNDEDNRSFKLYILPKAEEIKDKVQDCWKESSELALKGISESEQQYFLKILEKIENNTLINLK
jgi:MarR family transcriptional regulator, organic hydroperoxide resistance regulator